MEWSKEGFQRCIADKKPYFGNVLRARQSYPEVRHGYMQKLIAQECLNRKFAYHILEIGCWAGASTITFLSAIKKYNARKGKVFCIDPWEVYATPETIPKTMYWALEHDQIFRLFLHNIQTSGYIDDIIILKTKSDEILPFLGNNFNLIYIDGNHAYRQFKKDLINSIPLVKNGGILCGDDFEASVGDGKINPFEVTEIDPHIQYVKQNGIEYHPGVSRALWETFDVVPSWDGFWAVRKNDGDWEPVVLNDWKTSEEPEHLHMDEKYQ